MVLSAICNPRDRNNRVRRYPDRKPTRLVSEVDAPLLAREAVAEQDALDLQVSAAQGRIGAGIPEPGRVHLKRNRVATLPSNG
jgi:hypothetical protein